MFLRVYIELVLEVDIDEELVAIFGRGSIERFAPIHISIEVGFDGFF